MPKVDPHVAPPSPRGEPLRVLFLSAAGLLGGAERSLYELLRALPEHGIEAHVCAPPEGDLLRLCRAAGVQVHEVALRRFRRTLHPVVLAGQVRALFSGSQQVQRLVQEHGIRVLQANISSAALVAWEVGRETGCPFIWHCRDLRPLGPLARILGRSAACAVAISRAVQDRLVSQGLPRERVKLICNGIDLTRWHGPEDRPAVRARVRKQLRLGIDDPVLIDVGGWVSWKRHELFLAALEDVRRRLPHAVGLLVGSDLFQQNAGYAAFLDDCLRVCGLLEGGLRVLWQRDDVPDLLAAADILVSPSEDEPFGRVLAEAGAAGLPVVSTRSGGKPEIILDGETGILTPSGDAPSLAEACVKLLCEPGARREMGEKARRHVAERFDIRRTARETAELLWTVAEEHDTKGKG